jgi:hypothetical protein
MLGIAVILDAIRVGIAGDLGRPRHARSNREVAARMARGRCRKSGSASTNLAILGFAVWALIGSPACHPGGSPDPEMAARLDAAVDAAVDCFAPRDHLEPERLWFLLRAQKRLQHPRLGPVLERLRTLSTTDLMAVLVNPEAVPSDAWSRSRGPLAQLREPMRTYLWLMRQSIACRGGETPAPQLLDFVRGDFEGYILTHQLLAMEWARSVGCSVPGDWPSRQQELVDRVLAELHEDDEYTDLFVERVAVVALSGDVRDVRREWIELILSAQQADGCWESPPFEFTIALYGRSITLEGQDLKRTHASSLAVLLLTRYLESVR